MRVHANTGVGGRWFSVVTVLCLAWLSTHGVQAQTAWTKVNNAVPANSNTTSTDGRIPRGTSGGDTAHAFGPAVIKIDGEYKMWYTGNNGSNGRIFHATSTNGLDWEKVNNAIESASNSGGTDGRIPLGLTGSGDANSLQRLWVLHDGDTFKMWYGGSASGTWRGYYATSSNGLDWVKVNNVIEAANNTTGTDGRIPLGGSGRGDVSHAYILGVIKDDAVYRMWYTGNDGSWNSIYYATSPDGLTWTKINNVKPTFTNTGPTSDGRIPRGTSGGDANAVISGSVMRVGPVFPEPDPGRIGEKTNG